MGNLLLKFLIVEYIIVATAYAFQKDWPRAMYFIGATIISAGVLLMK